MTAKTTTKAKQTKKAKEPKEAKTPAKAKQALEPGDFEKALDELNALAEKMERGNLPLEQSLQHFESGVGLIRQCQKALSKAEQRVKILTTQSDTDTLTPFDPDDNR